MTRNPLIDEYIEKAAPEQAGLMKLIRQIIHNRVPDIKEDFKWSRPVFAIEKDEVYFKTAKAYLTLGFFHADKIKTRADLLDGSGKDMRHIKLKKLSEFNEELLFTWLEEIKN